MYYLSGCRIFPLKLVIRRRRRFHACAHAQCILTSTFSVNQPYQQNRQYNQHGQESEAYAHLARGIDRPTDDSGTDYRAALVGESIQSVKSGLMSWGDEDGVERATIR